MADPILLQAGIVGMQFGERVKIVQPANVCVCSIGDDCFVGPFVEILMSVSIGKNHRVQSHAFICELVTIGNDCFIGNGVMFISDVLSKGGLAWGDASLWRSTRIGSKVSIGSNATILPVDICDGVVIGAGAVVTKPITVPGIYAGNPARLIRAL